MTQAQGHLTPCASDRQSQRIGGYAPISTYAAIGDGRTVALVAGDGSIDWLPLPELDSASVFCALLDAGRGGRFALAPEEPYAVERRYLPGTNVLETVFSTDAGAVRVTDALTVPAGALGPLRELARRIEGLAGRVPMAWSVEPRFAYAGESSRLGWRARVPVATAGGDALAVCAFDAGAPEIAAGAIRGRFEARAGTRALLSLSAAHGEPLVLPARDQVEARLDETAAIWRRWSDDLTYAGPFRRPFCAVLSRSSCSSTRPQEQWPRRRRRRCPRGSAVSATGITGSRGSGIRRLRSTRSWGSAAPRRRARTSGG